MLGYKKILPVHRQAVCQVKIFIPPDLKFELGKLVSSVPAVNVFDSVIHGDGRSRNEVHLKTVI